MRMDLNHAPPMCELIPDGTFAKVTMTIRPGGVDGDEEIDRNLLKRSGVPNSDVLSLDCEFTVAEGEYAHRRFRHCLPVSGGKLDETGASIGARITGQTLRGIVDSAFGLHPADTSEAARSMRVLRGFADLSGLSFVARIRLEPIRYRGSAGRNRLDRAVLPSEPEWPTVMNGEAAPARPTLPRPVRASSVPGHVTDPPTTCIGGSPDDDPMPPGGPAWLNV